MNAGDRTREGTIPDVGGPGSSSDKITAEHARDVFAPRGLTAADAERFGAYSVTAPEELPEEFRAGRFATIPGLVFPWRSPSGYAVLQYRPDEPVSNSDGVPVKYVFPIDSGMVLSRLRDDDGIGPILLSEGTMQSIAAAVHAPREFAVYGLPGCWGWRDGGTSVAIPDLSVVDGREVIVALDADAASNLNVYNAGMELKDALEVQGATNVRFLRLAGAGRKAGLDDYLAAQPADRRAIVLARLIERAGTKPADARPKAKPKKASASEFFSDTGSLRAEALSVAVVERHPAALTEERRVALYLDGAYRIDGAALIGSVARLLGDEFRPLHRSTVEEFLVGRLYNDGRVLPTHIDRPLLNVRNGMLDLATGELLPHHPAYLSSVQFPVTWDADATAPTYERWLGEVIPDQADDLEEVASQMLDPSQTPTKAVFLYGPSRSGKSTFLRLMQAMAGTENTSAVTLHQLSTDRFAAANVFGKALNVASDMKAADVEDVSIFKMMTGNDPVQANRKYGSQFTFRNRALFAFGGNSLPAVAESSRAYSERVKPFRFAQTFAGREDPAIEAAMVRELPGILVRWVKAWQRREARGAFLPTVTAVREEFELGSDRVRLFVASCCTVHPSGTATVPADQMATKSVLHRAFMQWADDQRGGGMGQVKFVERLSTIAGVRDVRAEKTKARGLNVTVKPQGQWGQEDEDEDGDRAGPPVAKVATLTYPMPDAEARPSIKSTDEERVSWGEQGGGNLPPLPLSPPCPFCDAPMLVSEGGSGVDWLCEYYDDGSCDGWLPICSTFPLHAEAA
ncbi:phage/plasmid primase, P4 family [Blastococcus sp. SYSU DS1021]